MRRVMAVANQKGGVGKTTTAVNLAASFAAMRRHVLLIDLDPQGNATAGCGIDKTRIERGSCEVLLGECTAAEAILPCTAGATPVTSGRTATSTGAPAAPAVPTDASATAATPATQATAVIPPTPAPSAVSASSPVAPAAGSLWILPTNQDLTSAEVRLLTMAEQREQRLRLALVPIRSSYDLILIDCPPALNMLAVNALVAADSVLIPMQCEYYALEGLSALMATIEQIRATANTELAIEGILRTMYDSRNNLATEVSAQLMMHFGNAVFRTVVPRNVRLAEAPSFGKSALAHDPDSRGALAYLALAGEMLRREEELQDAAMMRA